jgi:hypothetical protein
MARTEHTDDTRRPRGLEDAGPDPTVGDLRRQQHREVQHFGLVTEGQTKGAAMGWIVGAVLGGLLLLVVGALVSNATGVIVVLAVMGVLFGGVAGGVYGGSRGPERTRETVDLHGRPETQPADDLD